MRDNNIRVLMINNLKTAEIELKKIDPEYKGNKAIIDKGVFRSIKISNLDARAANLLKLEGVYSGIEVICSKDVIMFSTSKTDVILSGRISDFEILYFKLKSQPFGLSDLADKIKSILLKFDNKLEIVKYKNKEFDFNLKTYVMGILNITPDSFSDGGKYNSVDEAVKKIIKMKNEGADIIDIGAESSRPGANEVSKDEELERLLPIISKIMKEVDITISVDTYKSEVAKEVLKLGVPIINDITGLKGDKKMADTISDYDAHVIIMHMQGIPKNMQDNPLYNDVVEDIIQDFRDSIRIAQISGIVEKNIILDPGIGFGKKLEDNLEILRRLKEFRSLGLPILIGASRKTMIGQVLDAGLDQRLEGSLAIAANSANNGASILRVHDVKETVRVLKMIDAINGRKY